MPQCLIYLQMFSQEVQLQAQLQLQVVQLHQQELPMLSTGQAMIILITIMGIMVIQDLMVTLNLIHILAMVNVHCLIITILHHLLRIITDQEGMYFFSLKRTQRSKIERVN